MLVQSREKLEWSVLSCEMHHMAHTLFYQKRKTYSHGVRLTLIIYYTACNSRYMQKKKVFASI